MDIESLKDKLDDATFTSLKEHVEALTAQRDAAKKESIDGRKNMKARISELEAATAKTLEKLGVDSLDDLDELPDAKGQAEAIKQFDVKMKRLEKLLSDKETELSSVSGKFQQSQLDAMLHKALGSHEFVDRDTAATLIKTGIEWDGDQPMFKTEEGQLVSLSDGVTHLAKTKTFLLKSQGAGGSGFGKNGGTGGTGQLPETLTPEQRLIAARQAAQG